MHSGFCFADIQAIDGCITAVSELSMPQSRIHAETDEATARRLLEIYETAFEDAGYPVSAFENPEAPLIWEISVYVETDMADATRMHMRTMAGESGHEIGFEREDIPETDWVKKTLRELSSVRAGRFIVHGSHEADIPKPHEIAIQINAGLAFGTGHHGTTAGCLDMLNRVMKRRKFSNVLDLGTGSGVLAIAAAKALPCFVTATDIDPVATETASYNARLNGVQANVHCLTARGFNNRIIQQQAPYDLVIANILAKPLQQMARDLANHTAHGGMVILSGLLPHQRAPLVAGFRLQGLYLEHYHTRDGWLTLVLGKS